MTDATLHRLPARAVLAAYLQGAPATTALCLTATLYVTNPQLWPGTWAAAVMALFIAVRLLHPLVVWATLRFGVTPAGLQVERGALARRHTIVEWDRVSVTENARPWAFRLVGLSSVTVRVGGETTAEGLFALPGVCLADAAELTSRAAGPAAENPARLDDPTDAIDAAEPVSVERASDPERRVLYRASIGQLLLAALAQGQIIVFGAGAVIAVFDLLQQWGWLTGEWLRSNLVLVAAVAVVAVVVLGMTITVIRFYDFEVVRDGARLHLSYGLFERHDREVTGTSVIGVRAQRNLLEMAFDLARFRLLSESAGGADAANALFPVLPRAVLLRVLSGADAALPVPDLLQRRAGAALVSAGFAALLLAASGAGAAYAGHVVMGWPLYAVIALAAAAMLVVHLLTRLAARRIALRHSFLFVHERHVLERHDLVRPDALHFVSTGGMGRARVRGVIIGYFAGMPRTVVAFTRDHALLAHLRSELGAAAHRHAVVRRRHREDQQEPQERTPR